MIAPRARSKTTRRHCGSRGHLLRVSQTLHEVTATFHVLLALIQNKTCAVLFRLQGVKSVSHTVPPPRSPGECCFSCSNARTCVSTATALSVRDCTYTTLPPAVLDVALRLLLLPLVHMHGSQQVLVLTQALRAGDGLKKNSYVPAGTVCGKSVHGESSSLRLQRRRVLLPALRRP